MRNPYHEEAKKISRVELASGYSISRILKGGWQLAGGHGPVDKKQAIEDMFAFAEAGITTFDFGDIYTGVEELVGEFLNQYRRKINKKSINGIQLHTKFVPDMSSLSTITKKDVEQGINRSLQRLGVEQLDFVQFHWWDYDIPRYLEVATYLAHLQKAGKIKHIGLTNFDVPRVKEFLDASIPVISHQVQYSVLDHRPEHGMIRFCKEYGIKLLCYGTVAGGFLSEKYLEVPAPQEPLENRSLTKYKLIIDEFGGWELFQELLTTLSSVAKKHNMSIANVASRYILDKPQVAGVIIGARNTSHLEDALNIFNFELNKDDRDLIKRVIGQSKGPKGDAYDLERIKGGRHAGIMKYNLNKN